MKFVAIILTVLLFYPVYNSICLLSAYYNSQNDFGIDMKLFITSEKSLIIMAAVCAITFGASVFLNVNRKYMLNTIIAAIGIISYIALTRFIGL